VRSPFSPLVDTTVRPCFFAKAPPALRVQPGYTESGTRLRDEIRATEDPCALPIVLLSTLLIPAGLYASTVYDSFNIGLPLQDGQNGDDCCVFGIEDIGWYYTASTSYTLNQIETIFDTLGTNRTITFAVYTDRPANGGTLL